MKKEYLRGKYHGYEGVPIESANPDYVRGYDAGVKKQAAESRQYESELREEAHICNPDW